MIILFHYSIVLTDIRSSKSQQAFTLTFAVSALRIKAYNAIKPINLSYLT